jgi:TorA maturation chaperone TorD
MATKQDIVDFLNDNASTYQFLSQVFFKELTEEAICEIEGIEFPEDAQNEHLNRGYNLVKRYFAFAESDKRTQLAVEYSRVFLAAGVFTKKTTTAVPYESVFTSEEHIMMQESRDDCVARYIADGFYVNPDLHEPEDHLAFELEYMSHMSVRAAELLEAGEREEFLRNVARQREFIELHLLNWLPDLLVIAKDFAKLAFYLGMLEVAIGTSEETHAMLCEIEEHVHA